jgi:hypothetical protein
VTDFDPMFNFTAKILRIRSGSPEFLAGETVTFAIHSPAMLFPQYEQQPVPGHSFQFMLYGTKRKGENDYHFICTICPDDATE